MTDRVSVNIEHGIATVTLNRAEKHNAVDMAMFEALVEAGESLKQAPSVRAVILCGAGGNFCSGIDVSVFGGQGIGAVGSKQMEPRHGSPANIFQSAAWIWQELPVPVIAALQGAVFGAGLQIALAADIRYASPDTQMSIMEIKWGLIPDMAISCTARHLLRADTLKELAFTARVLSGNEARAAGLVTALVDEPIGAAATLAQDISQRSPDAVRAMKRLINVTWQTDPAASLRLEAELQLELMRGENQAEAVRANVGKRAPVFSDPER